MLGDPPFSPLVYALCSTTTWFVRSWKRNRPFFIQIHFPSASHSHHTRLSIRNFSTRPTHCILGLCGNVACRVCGTHSTQCFTAAFFAVWICGCRREIVFHRVFDGRHSMDGQEIAKRLNLANYYIRKKIDLDLELFGQNRNSRNARERKREKKQEKINCESDFCHFDSRK